MDDEPLELRWIRAHGLRSLTPWHFLKPGPGSDAIRAQCQANVFEPFAQRFDCDDVAAFEIDAGERTGRVATIHLSWGAGQSRISMHDTFWSWLKTALDATAQSCTEEGLAEVDVD